MLECNALLSSRELDEILHRSQNIYLKAHYKNIVISLLCSVSHKTVPTFSNVLMLCERLCQIFWPLAFYQWNARFQYGVIVRFVSPEVGLSAAPHSSLCLNKSRTSPDISNKYLDIFSHHSHCFTSRSFTLQKSSETQNRFIFSIFICTTLLR